MSGSDEEQQVDIGDQIADLSSDEEDYQCDDDDYVKVVRRPLFERVTKRLRNEQRARPRAPEQVAGPQVEWSQVKSNLSPFTVIEICGV